MVGKARTRNSHRWKSRAPTTVVAVRIYRFSIPLRERFAISGASVGRAGNVLVAIDTADGRTGWGEASPVQRVTGENEATCLAAAPRLREVVLGRDAARIGAGVAAMERAVPNQPTIRSAFDLALFDLAAQRAGLPLFRYLGGPRKARPLPTDATIFLRPLDTVADRARELLGDGFTMLKLKLGDAARDDVERVRRVREAAGPEVVLRVDANQGWARGYAIKTLRAIARFGLQFCEQPLPASDREGLHVLGARSPVPLMADEALFTPADAEQLVAAGDYPLFNIKLSKSAGLHRARAIARIARRAGIPCMTGCMNESRLGLTAAAHFAAAMPGVVFYDLDSHLMQTRDWVEGGLRIRKGHVFVPEEPGLGARPKPSWLARQTAL